jgi:hypothetical protein
MTPNADTDSNISERRHDPLCVWAGKLPLTEPCDHCAYVAEVRSDERDKMPSCTFDCHECRVMDFFGIGEAEND